MQPDPFERCSVVEAINHAWLKSELKAGIYMTDREWQDSLWSRNIGDHQEQITTKRHVQESEEEADGEDLNDEEEEYEWISNGSDTNDSVLECDKSYQRIQLNQVTKKNRLVDLSLLDNSLDYADSDN